MKLQAIIDSMAVYVLEHPAGDVLFLWNEWILTEHTNENDRPFLIAIMNELVDMDHDLLREIVACIDLDKGYEKGGYISRGNVTENGKML